MSYKQDLLRAVKANITTANAILHDLDDTGYGKLSVINYSLTKQAKITGRNKNIRSFAIGKANTIKKLEQLNRQLNIFINSNWVTPEGREEIAARAANTLYNRSKSPDRMGIPGDMTIEQAIRAVDLFATTAYASGLEAGVLSSLELLDLIDMGYDNGQIERAMDYAYENGESIYQSLSEVGDPNI